MTSPIPDTLYHYTSPEGALGIVKSGEVWASMIHYLNDSGEFKLALRLVQELIADAHELPDDVRHLVNDEFISVVRSVAVFVFSLSAQKDLLSQWRAYSPNGGYALGFSKDVLDAIVSEDNAALVPCVYDDAKQRIILRPVVETLIRAAKELPEGADGLDLYRTVANEFTRTAAVIKDKSFEAEEEWRIIFGPTGVDKAKTDARTAGSIVVPYLRCQIKRGGRYPIAECVVGPGQDVDLAGRSLRYVTTSMFHWPVKVTSSTSTFRVLS